MPTFPKGKPVQLPRLKAPRSLSRNFGKDLFFLACLALVGIFGFDRVSCIRGWPQIPIELRVPSKHWFFSPPHLYPRAVSTGMYPHACFNAVVGLKPRSSCTLNKYSTLHTCVPSFKQISGLLEHHLSHKEFHSLFRTQGPWSQSKSLECGLQQCKQISKLIKLYGLTCASDCTSYALES